MYKVYKDHADGTYCIELRERYIWVKALKPDKYPVSSNLGGGYEIEEVQTEGFESVSGESVGPYTLGHDDQIEVLIELDTLDKALNYIEMVQLIED